MNKTYLLLFLMALCALFYSCDYEPEGTNYVEIQKPGEDLPIDVIIYAPQNANGKYEVNYRYLMINIDTELDLSYYNCYIDLKSKDSDYIYDSWSFYSNSYKQIDLSWHDPGEYLLEFRASIPSSTESIANAFGQEYIAYTKSWRIIRNTPTIPSLNLRYEELGNNQYQISWDKPDPYYGEVAFYELFIDYPFSKTIKTTELSWVVALENSYDWEQSVQVYLSAYFKEYGVNSLSDYIYIKY